MHTKLIALVFSITFAVTAWGKPARLTIRVPRSDLHFGTSVEVEILPIGNEEPDRFLRIEGGRVSSRRSVASATSPVRLLTAPNAAIQLQDLPEGVIIDNPEMPFFISSKGLGKGVELLVSRDELSVRGIELTPGIKYKTVTHYRILDKEFPAAEQSINAFSGEANEMTARRPSVLHNIIEATFAKQNLPVGISVLFGAALVAAIRERLKSVWDVLLTWIGMHGVRRLAERSFTRKYLRNLQYQHKYLKLVGLLAARFSPPLLERVFVSLRIAAQQSDNSRAGVSVPFANAVAKFQKFVILGAPGAGKTTTLSYTVLQFASGRRTNEFGISEPFLPIFIPLRRVLSSNASLIDDIVDRETQIIPDEVLEHLPAGYFERRLKKGECILLLDGMDEVASESAHRQIAQKIINLTVSYPKNRFIVTCRVAGWQGLLPDFEILQTQDLNRNEIQTFITGWHAAVITEKERSEVRLKEPDDLRFADAWKKRRDAVATAIDVQSRKLSNAIESNQRIQAVATNPMLLSLICLVHLNRHILPRGRSLLYRECIELLTDTWDRSRDLVAPDELTYTQKEAALRHMALEFQRVGKGELSRSEIEKVAAEVAQNVGASITPAAFVEALERRSGLLIERSIDVLGFSHLTLQEYLVARHIQQNPELVEFLIANFDFQGWREVILLYCGLVDDATSIIDAILSDPSDMRVLLAAHCIGESQKCDQPLIATVTEKLISWLGKSPVPEEELVGALAAVAADYKETPATIEQKLAEVLIEHVDQGTDQAVVAIQSLGRARIIRALPALIEAALREPPNRAAFVAIVGFGNLALSELGRPARDSPSRLSVRVTVLEMISTSLAARAMLRYFSTTDDTWNYKLACAVIRTLRARSIREDFMELGSDEIPELIRNGPLRERDGWKYERSPSESFLRLDGFLRRVLSARIETAFESQESLGVRIVIPSLLERLRSDRGFYASPSLLRSMGFEIDESNLAVAQQLNSAVKRYEVELWQTLEQASRVAMSHGVEKEGRTRRLLRFATVGSATLLYLFTMSLIVTLIRLNTKPPIETVISMDLLRWAEMSLIVYVALTLLALWWRRRRFRSLEFYGTAVFPLLACLRRIPLIASGWPWVGFGVFAAIVMACSLTGLVGMIMIVKVGPLLWDSSLVLLASSGIALVVCLAHYYRTVVLRTDILRELLLLHPEGIELLRAPRV